MKSVYSSTIRICRFPILPQVWGSLILLAQSAQAQPRSLDDFSHRVEKRVPWTESRIAGSPEPPSLYRTERVFPKLKFVEPLEMVAIPNGDRFVVAEHAGRIYSFPDRQDCQALDVFADMKLWNPEIQEVYSVTFHPQFSKNRFVYIWYILKAELPEGTRISRFKVTDSNPPQVDLTTEHPVIMWKSGGHNGGCARFGKDGMLYISTGDGVGPDPPDTFDTGQNIGDLLSSILRIDVDHESDGRGYAIPADNPFIHEPGARPEVWAYGLRNPWRMSVDLKTGDVWVGDVGWELWEMVHRIERGGNYGWSIMEGSRQQIKPDGKRGPTPILPPTYEHPHSEAASITGGLVYHGSRLRDLKGAYLYGDFETGKIWALHHDGTRVTSHQELVDTPLKVVSFAEDATGELYIVDFNGTIQELRPNPLAGQPSTFPRKLSEAGLFRSTLTLEPAPGVISYSVNAEQWADGATSVRLVGLPGESAIDTAASPWTFPKDAVLARTLSLPIEPDQPEKTARKVETQILHFNGEAWNAYAYQWNDEQTDATLVPAAGAEQVFHLRDPSAESGLRQQTWRFSSRAECLRCHNPWCGSVLGFNGAQLDRDHRYAGSGAVAWRPQLATLDDLGVLSHRSETKKTQHLANPYSADAALDERARAWLHVNCSHCHREHAGGSVLSFMNSDWPLERLNLVGARPMQGDFGIADAKVVAAGDPCRSVLFFRISKLGKGHMPYLGSRVIDARGTALIYDWISSLRAQGDDDSGLRRLARDHAAAVRLRSADGLERSSIITNLLRTSSGALALLHTLEEPSIPRDLVAAVMTRVALLPERPIADLFERFVPEEKRVKTLGTDINPQTILALKGDAGRGRKLFFQPGGAQCITCHRVGREGRDFGPDLSLIGKKYTRGQLIENILQPSKLIDPKFIAYALETKDGTTHTGFVLERDSRQVLIREAAGFESKVATDQIVRLEPQKLSAMPEGLLQNLTAQEAADLLEFLAQCR